MDPANGIAGKDTTIGHHRQAPDRNLRGAELLGGGITRRCVQCPEQDAAAAVGRDQPSGRVECNPQTCCLHPATRRYQCGDRLARRAPDPHRTTSLPHRGHPAVAAVDSDPHHTVGLWGRPPSGQLPSIRGPHRHKTIPTSCGQAAGLGTGGHRIDPYSWVGRPLPPNPIPQWDQENVPIGRRNHQAAALVPEQHRLR